MPTTIWNTDECPAYLGLWPKGGEADSFDKVFTTHNQGVRQFRHIQCADSDLRPNPGEVLYVWLTTGIGQVAWQNETSTELLPGDVIVLYGNDYCHIIGEGSFAYLAVKADQPPPMTGIARIIDLPDTAGGCNPSENAFRRLQVVWAMASGDEPDGNNYVGCHVVWIAESSSRTHYHPVPAVNGGASQHEMYLVLDPTLYDLKADAQQPGVWTYQHVGKWDEADFTPLKAGDIMYIPPGIPHRAVDILACVIAIPGFKPQNELFLDQRIHQEAPSAHFNKHFI